jgi:uncharacterized spore protein YtfJ
VDAENLLGKASDNLWVRRAFGAPYEKNGVLIIPVATVFGGGGAGTTRIRRDDPSSLPGNSTEGGAATPLSDSPTVNAGGGFGGLVLPSGVYVVKNDQVRWVPAWDVTIVALASLSLVRVLARTWTRRRRHHS